jgi:hypothetical protein
VNTLFKENRELSFYCSSLAWYISILVATNAFCVKPKVYWGYKLNSIKLKVKQIDPLYFKYKYTVECNKAFRVGL